MEVKIFDIERDHQGIKDKLVECVRDVLTNG